MVDDVLFWLVATAFLLLWAGAAGTIFPYTRPFVLTVAAYLGFLVYAALALMRWRRKPFPNLELIIPILTLLGVLTFSGGIPGGLTGMGAAVGVSALILTYLSYQSWRDKTMGKPLTMREPPEQNKPQPG